MDDPLSASYAFCDALARREARNFYHGFRLLPIDRRRAMSALYAFMRHTDDLADEPGPSQLKHAALADWRADLDAALNGQPASWPGLPALADTVRRYEIPVRHLHEVLDGVAMDLAPQPFETFEDLRRYCHHVASAVGLCCLRIWGYHSAGGSAEHLAECCGVALQLTNILRDIGEDARQGRVYLPREDRERFGVRFEDFRRDELHEPLRRLLAFEAARAYDFYNQAAPLVRLIEPAGRPICRAIVGTYRALLDEIARRDFDVLSARVAVPSWRKTLIAARSLLGC